MSKQRDIGMGFLMQRLCQPETEKLMGTNESQSWRFRHEALKHVHPLNTTRDVVDFGRDFKISQSHEVDEKRLFQYRDNLNGFCAVAVCRADKEQVGSGFIISPPVALTEDMCAELGLSPLLWEGKTVVGFASAWHLFEDGDVPLLTTSVHVDGLVSDKCFAKRYQLLYTPKQFHQFQGLKRPADDIVLGVMTCHTIRNGPMFPFLNYAPDNFFCVPSATPVEAAQGNVIAVVGYPGKVGLQTAAQYVPASASYNGRLLSTVKEEIRQHCLVENHLSISAGNVVARSSDNCIIRHRASAVPGMSGSFVGRVEKRCVVEAVHFQAHGNKAVNEQEEDQNFNHAASVHSNIFVLGYTRYILPLLSAAGADVMCDQSMVDELKGYLGYHRELLTQHNLWDKAEKFLAQYNN